MKDNTLYFTKIWGEEQKENVDTQSEQLKDKIISGTDMTLFNT